MYVCVMFLLLVTGDLLSESFQLCRCFITCALMTCFKFCKDFCVYSIPYCMCICVCHYYNIFYITVKSLFVIFITENVK